MRQMVTTALPAAPGVDAILARLDPEQRSAAVLPDGPAQIIAPAGSGKTTTLIARLGVLLEGGLAPDRICVVTFNRDAAAELSSRISHQLGSAATAIEVRTLHALARRVTGVEEHPARLVADRLPLLRAARRRHAAADASVLLPEAPQLDTWLSAWKVEGRPPPEESRAVLASFADLMASRGLIDFDDLVVGAVAALDEDARLRARWQSRFLHVCVDEFQDVDAAQLRLVRLLAAPEDNLFVVGDDDQP